MSQFLVTGNLQCILIMMTRPQNILFRSKHFAALSSITKTFIHQQQEVLVAKIDFTSFHPGLFSSWSLLFFTRGVLVEIITAGDFNVHENEWLGSSCTSAAGVALHGFC